MPRLFDETVQKQVREVFASLLHPVEILFFGSSDPARCPYCAETQQLLQEVSELSPLLTCKVFDLAADAALARQYRVDEVPEFVLVGQDGEKTIDYGIRYKGIPAGHEFSSLIHDLVLVSQRDSNLRPETRKFLQELTQPVHLQVFVTPTCPYCPRAVILAHQFAIESSLVEAEMVEAMEFPELSARFEVSGVPQTTINRGAGTLIGAAPEQNLVEAIRKALERTPAYPNESLPSE